MPFSYIFCKYKFIYKLNINKISKKERKNDEKFSTYKKNILSLHYKITTHMNMNDDLKKYLVLSRNFALKQNDSKVRLEYLLYYIMNNDATLKKTLKKYIKDYELFFNRMLWFLIKKLSNNELVQGDDIDNSIIPFDNLLLDVLTKCKNKNIGVIHILDLFETSLEIDILIIQKLKSYGITENIIKKFKKYQHYLKIILNIVIIMRKQYSKKPQINQKHQ